MSDQYAFLASLRTALSQQARAPGRREGDRRMVELSLHPTAGGKRDAPAVTRAAEVRGAGDVLSVDSRMIATVEPEPGSRGFEPNYFPYVDFVDADFPWRYSLDTSDGEQVKPWLALLALMQDEFRDLGRGVGPLPRIEVFSRKLSLPDLEHSWATAHAQVTLNSESGPKTVKGALASHPSALHSRLMCLRKLDPSVDYHLFLVPVFKAGLDAGLGRSDSGGTFAALAWDVAEDGPAEIPVYARWSFRTSEREDFELLASRLRAHTLTGDSDSTRTVSCGRPGYYEDHAKPKDTFEAEGALMPLTFQRRPRPIEKRSLVGRLEQTLSEIAKGRAVTAEKADGPDVEDPLVALPVYGQHHAQVAEIDATARTRKWVHETNLDLRFRLAAGVGARIVRRHQEPFMRTCWSQVGDIVAANQMLGRLQTVERLNDILINRHLVSLPAEVVLSNAEPMLALVREPGGTAKSAQQKLQVDGLPAGQVGRASRRVSAKRPVSVAIKPGATSATRKMVVPCLSLPQATTSSTGATTSTGRVVGRKVASARPTLGGTTLTRSAATTTATKKATAAKAAKSTAARKTMVRPQAVGDKTIGGDRVIETGVLDILQPRFEAVPVDGKSYVAVVDAGLRALPSLKAKDRISGLQPKQVEKLEPVMQGPEITDPLSQYVTEEDVEFLLPGASSLPLNTVCVVEENRAFIEALMVGANHEMGRELRWREFPTDLMATVFARFWNKATGEKAAKKKAPLDDIKPLHAWRRTLGLNAIGGDTGNIVFVVRGELIRRYPGVLVQLVRRKITAAKDWKKEPAKNEQTEHDPIFKGRLDADTAFYGFDLDETELRDAIDEYHIMFYEPPGRFRFGLDIATHSARQKARASAVEPKSFPLKSLDAQVRGALDLPVQEVKARKTTRRGGTTAASPDDLSWGDPNIHTSASNHLGVAASFSDVSNAAKFALTVRQKPIRAVVPARRLIEDG